MFCPKCGTKNLDDARFCCECGNSLPAEPHSLPLSQAETPSSSTSAKQSVSTTTRKKPKIWLAGVVILLVAVIAAAAVFFIRASGENNLLSSVTSSIADGSEEDVEAYYDQFLPVAYADGGYTQECHYDQFQMEKGSDGNTFLITGTLAVTDLSIEERPSYQINVSGTVKTNFFRSEYTVEWSYDFEEPETRLTYESLIGVYADGPIDDIYSSALYITQDGDTLYIDYSSYRAGSGDFSVTFNSQSEWPAIKGNSIQFAAEPWYIDGTYQITLTYIPASEAATGVDTICMTCPNLFDDCTFTRTSLESQTDFPAEDFSSGYDNGYQYDEDGMLVSIPIDTSFPFGYYEKRGGGAIEIGYTTDESELIYFRFYENRVNGYYGGSWLQDEDYAAYFDWFDVTMSNWNLTIDGTRVDIFISSIGMTVTAYGTLGSLSADQISGTYYLKQQAIQP